MSSKDPNNKDADIVITARVAKEQAKKDIEDLRKQLVQSVHKSNKEVADAESKGRKERHAAAAKDDKLAGDAEYERDQKIQQKMLTFRTMMGQRRNKEAEQEAKTYSRIV